jgi:hypothetical protein
MRTRVFGTAAVLSAALLLGQATPSRAQYGYPVGYGGYGWGGWGGGGQTVQGSIARGMGAYAAGAGYYNQQTAVARSINADTVMRWNQYMYESQVTANRAERERIAKRASDTNAARDQIEKRLRENPEPRDIYQGDALNMAVEEINHPKVYAKALAGAKATIPGETVRNIPFQYAPGAITVSIHQLTKGAPPSALMSHEFDEDRAAFKALGQEIRSQLEEGKNPDPATIDKALDVINTAEAKADRTLPRNSRERVEADKYLKSLHGLIAMLKTPALDVILSGVEKRPDVTLGELLNFMGAFNLRFGPATTPRQREVYDRLYPALDKLRDEVAPALAATTGPAATGDEPGEFFSGMSYDDLKKKAPAPPKPGAPR